jgi:hypothetical protein
MRPFTALLLSAALAGCAASPSSGPAGVPAERPENVVLVASPDGGPIASCDLWGRWTQSGVAVEHWLFQPDDKREFTTADGARSFGLFRGTVPFPHHVWQPSDFQVNQIVYPTSGGFVAMYHVMNHGNDPRTCRLFLGVAEQTPSTRSGRALLVGGKPVLVASEEPVAAAEGSRGRTALAYDLAIEPGASSFVFLTTPDLEGKVTPDLLDRAAALWEKRLSGRRVTVPDPKAMTAYYADLAAAVLGVAGCEARAAELESRLARAEGGALRLLAGVPESWLGETIEAEGIPTPHGPLSFRYEGAYFNRTFVLGEGCRPPDGFRIAVPASLQAKIDGKPADAKDGVLTVPAGARRVEMTVRG